MLFLSVLKGVLYKMWGIYPFHQNRIFDFIIFSFSLDLLAVSQFLQPLGEASLQSTLRSLPQQHSPVPLSNSSCSRCYRCLQAAAHQYVSSHCLDLQISVFNLSQSQSNNSTGATPFKEGLAECGGTISSDFSFLIKERYLLITLWRHKMIWCFFC